ncbi:MAG: hypothetical protein M3N82_00135 [Pseudomonadota bacterium]|nr:hypothetical protein [Pseudomonadota bacterium]
MSLEQHRKVLAFAGQIKTARAEVDIIYVRNGHWSASSTGPAGEISLTAPGGESWPRLEGLMRILAGVGIVQAKVIFRGMPPVFAIESTKLSTSTAATTGLEQYAKVMAFSEKARSHKATVDLKFGSDGLWYAYATDVDGQYSLTPAYGEGWGRLEGLLQVLAGAGLIESNVTFEGMPPKLHAEINP